MTDGKLRIFTVGHSNRTIEAFLSVLQAYDIRRLVDIRSWPVSRRHPHFAWEALAASLAEDGITYVWEKALGGKRPVKRGCEIHTAIEQPMFRAYVEHLHSAEAREAIERVIASAMEANTAVMCAERDPMKCHRQFLSDRLAALYNAEVIHIKDEQENTPHRLSPSLCLDGERIIYSCPMQMSLPGTERQS